MKTNPLPGNHFLIFFTLNNVAYSRTWYKWNHLYISLFVRLLLLNIMFLRFIHVFGHISSFKKYCWVVFYCMTILQFVYPFSCLGLTSIYLLLWLKHICNIKVTILTTFKCVPFSLALSTFIICAPITYPELLIIPNRSSVVIKW